jgi:glycosyltransferase involved in cell wall biosynthesis
MARILKPEYDGFGIQTVLAGLLEGIASSSHPHEVLLLVDPGQLAHPTPLMQCYRLVPVLPHTGTTAGKLWWDHLAVGQVCQQHGVDALYAPAHARPAYAPCPTVVAIYDMMYHLFPHSWAWSDQMYFRAAVSTLSTRASCISTTSEHTRRDIHTILGIPPERVEVIYPGVPHGFSRLPATESATIRTTYHLSQPFMLYVGGFHPRKNMTGMLDAFEHAAPAVPHDLVIIGPPAWKNEQILQRIERSPVAARIHFTGFVPREDLPRFYNQADLFVFPSLYEGFGFPVLEALACGCPTITTRTSSIPEVAGDAAILVEPGDTRQLADAIRRLANDASLRAQMRQQALEQAQRFRWHTAARATLALLERAAAQREGRR